MEMEMEPQSPDKDMVFQMAATLATRVGIREMEWHSLKKLSWELRMSWWQLLNGPSPGIWWPTRATINADYSSFNYFSPASALLRIDHFSRGPATSQTHCKPIANPLQTTQELCICHSLVVVETLGLLLRLLYVSISTNRWEFCSCWGTVALKLLVEWEVGCFLWLLCQFRVRDLQWQLPSCEIARKSLLEWRNLGDFGRSNLASVRLC